MIIEYLTHAYRLGTEPFQNLSSLPDHESIKIMEKQYIEGSLMWKRFKDPKNYWAARKEVETWLYRLFIAKGGKPKQAYPIYMVVGGRPRWVERNLDVFTKRMLREIRVPFSIFRDSDISFTYPDSMVSRHFAKEKNPEYYQTGYHGEVFTRSEIITIVAEKGLPDEGWETNAPDHWPHYIEAQVWNHELLLGYMNQQQCE